jgi:hypothetical protein
MSLYETEWRERGYGLRATAMRINGKKVHSVEKYWVNALFAVVVLVSTPPLVTSSISTAFFPLSLTFLISLSARHAKQADGKGAGGGGEG